MSRSAIEEARLASPEVSWQERLILLEHATQHPVHRLIADKTTLEPKQSREFRRLLELRRNGTPMQIILGYASFLDFELDTESGVFIPRPETAQLVTETLARLKTKPRIVLEIGTGTGAIAIALARQFPDANVIAVDICPAALALAHRNAVKLGVSEQITFIRGDLFSSPGTQDFKRKADLLISNPPYIPSAMLESLPHEVRFFDPVLALDGGQDGFRIVEKILNSAPEFLIQGGLLALEVDPLLSRSLESYAKKHDFKLDTGVDSCGNLRFLFLEV